MAFFRHLILALSFTAVANTVPDKSPFETTSYSLQTRDNNTHNSNQTYNGTVEWVSPFFIGIVYDGIMNNNESQHPIPSYNQSTQLYQLLAENITNKASTNSCAVSHNQSSILEARWHGRPDPVYGCNATFNESSSVLTPITSCVNWLNNRSATAGCCALSFENAGLLVWNQYIQLSTVPQIHPAKDLGCNLDP